MKPYDPNLPAGSRMSRGATVDLTPFENYPSDQWLRGEVKKVLNFGAFVSVTLPDGGPTADGLVHISEIKDERVEDIHAELAVGQEVDVWIKQVGGGKLSFSMRGA